MGKAGMKDSGKTTTCADARDARLIREMHLSVVARASRKTGETLVHNSAVSKVFRVQYLTFDTIICWKMENGKWKMDYMNMDNTY